MSILDRLREQATAIALCDSIETKHGETSDIAYSLLQEIQEYLIAASDGSMSMNNSKQLTSELLQRIKA